MLGGIPLIF
jgi:hypothetical protein